MSAFARYFALSAPLFAVVLIGYAIAHWRRWQQQWTQWASKLVFNFALPAMLFHVLSDWSKLPPLNAKLLLAFFSGCFIVFFIGRWIASRAFNLDATAQSMFAMGGIFSNNVMLGLPLAKATIGKEAVPSVAMIVLFNALILWTLASVSVEWGKHGQVSLRGLPRLALNIVTSPLVAAVLAGLAFGATGLELPQMLEAMLARVSALAGPAALVALGMGLVPYGLRHGWQQSAVISALKLIVLPLVVWLIAHLLGLPPLETRVAVLLASMSLGANVYLMSIQFEAVQGPIASALVFSTAAAAVTTPLVLAMTA
jgi:predicted permease